MEKNGESDSNSMAVDPVSPASSNSKEVSDEPAAPRRNSIDDNDPTRPRKRLAAMLIHDNADNTKQALPAKDKVPYGESENEPRQSDQAMEHKNYNGTTSKPDKASLEDGHFSSPVAVKGIGNKVTIHLRTTGFPDTKEDRFEEPTIDDENDGLSQLTPTSSGPPRSVGSLEGESPNGSLCSPEIEVEEVEDMEEDEDLAGHIADVDQYINSPIIPRGSAGIKDVMDGVTSELERDPIPLRQLEELAHTMSSFVNVVGDQIDSFYKLYLVNQNVWPNLPNMMEALLKRSEPFGQNYFRRVDKSTPGLEAIILALVEFARLTALFVRYDAWSLEHALPDRDHTLLSLGYQRTLSIIMRPNQLSSLMQRAYNFNMVTILPRVMRAFIDTHDGLGTLRKYDELILQRIPLQPKLLSYASLPLEIYAKLIRCLEVVIKEGVMSEDLAEIQIAVSDGAFMAMTSVENLLAGLFETHLQLLIIKDFNVVLNTLCSLVTAFYGMSSAESRIRKLIEEKIGNEYGVIEAYEYPSLAEWSCRFPFLFKMLTSNRMDFRLQGLVRATELLVSAWRDSYGNGTDWHDSVLLRFLAHFIIENKIVEYIMGPESHHELIRRSANITGFLIVTNTTTVDIRHALWQPVVNNKDPRIVQATLAMHQEMIPNMSIPLLVELSKRIKDIPFSSFDAHMMELVSRLLETIRNNFYQQQVVHLDPPPYEMLIQLIRMASREEENTTPSGGLPPSTMFEFAGKELMALAEYGPAGELRRKIYLDCISDIKQMKSSATGSINVIQAFLQQRPRNVRPGSPGYVEDIEFLIKNLNLAELLVNEIARFVDSHSKHDQYSTLRRLKARLELLQFILYNSPECLTAHLGEKLWTYLVGVKALGTSERDDGFEFYINHYLKITAACVTNAPPQAHVSLTDQQQADPILESVFKIYFPALDPACFSPNVLPFCTKSIEYLNKPTGLADNFEEDCVNFEGVEQLWRIILKAPDDKLAAEATSYFMNLYLDTRAVCSKPAKVIENTHFMIVERCINQLTSTASNIDNTVPTVNTRDENAMSLDTFHGNSDTQEFFRSLDLLDHFVKGYKSRPKYNQGSQEANQSSAVDMITGVPLTLRLRWHASNFQSPIHSFQIGNLDTGQDLHDRIAKIVGGDKYRLIISGREFKPSHEPLKTLKDFCIPDNSVLIVQKSPDQGTVTASSSVPSNLNALQIEIMRHFDSLFELLSLPEPQATKIWFFLRNFPVDEHIKSSMISGSSWSETFPADYPYKTLYSLHALRTCFEEQRQQQNSDEKSTFINEATASLLKTLMNNNHESKESYAMKTRAQVTNEILDCLRLFLQESITECGFSPPFPNPEDFVERIFEILRVCSQKDYSQCPGSESCVANAFNVLLIASKIDSKVWSSLTQKSELIHHVNRFLLKDKRQTVRLGTGEAIIATFNRYLSTVKPTSHDFARFFWSILKDMLDQPWLDPKSSAEMFQTALLNFKFLSEVSPESLDIETCFKSWSSRLIKYEVNEVVGCSNEDFVVTGFARLLTRCVSLARSRGIHVYNEVAEDIFQNLLFRPMATYTENSQPIESLPCLHGPSRSEIYNLVIQLVNDPESCVKMVKHNLHLFPKDQSLHDGFHADRGRWARSVAGHVGLQNMSNTCYLNSLMTQLFMNRTFRAFILEMPIDQTDESQKLIHFLKVLFARMQNSYTKAVEPKDFVEAITDYEGEQIDIAVQMDVDEFFNLIFDRLEGQMPSMELKSSFRSHYGGQLVQQVKSNECPHISERTEPFSAIQCDIKGKSTLQESLKAYVEGEIMDGDNKYSCTTCDRHVDAVKRTCLKDIPNHLIFHLKRFEFDLQTMHRSKINDSFEFPTSIDMKPYTIEYLSGDEKNGENSSRDMFELVGVLVHSGTAESGHYYSYIRNRLSPSGAPEWFEFNDSEVSAFDPSTIPAACYGGTDGVTRDAMGQTYALSKPYSAYMLFYERSSLLSSSAVNQGEAVQTRLSIPRELELEIHSENEYFIRKYCMFDNNHIEFIRRLLDQQQRLFKNSTPYDHIHEKRALILGLDTLEQIATRFKDSTEGEALFSILNTYLINCPECCLEFFDWLCQKEDAITNLLVCNPYGKARANFLRLVMFALNQVRRKRPEAYGPIDESGDHDIEYEDTVLYKLCTSLMRSWNGLQWSIKTWGDYFGLLASISALGETEKVVMLDMGFLKKIMELLLMDHLQAPRKMEYLFENFAKIWAKRRPSLGNLGSVMGELMSLCDPHLRPCRDDENRTHFRHLSKFPLNSTEYDFFSFSAKSQMQILSRLLESQTTTESMARLVAHIVKSEVAPPEGPLLEQIKNTLLAGVPVDPAQEAEPFLICLLYFVSVTKSPNYVKEIIRRVSDEVPTIGTDGGSEHLLFFQELAVLKNAHLKPYLIKWRMIDYVALWAPPLLTYCDATVRENTEKLLDDILFDSLQDGDRPKARKGVEELMNGCFNFIESKLPRLRQPCDEKTFENVLRVLEKCGEYQEDEETFRARSNALRLLIEKIILEEEEDADLASDEWGGSENGSDTHEMEVQLDEYNST